MESSDREFILKMREVDARLKRLYENHQKFEDELDQYKNRPFLTTIDESREKELKFKKLRGVEKMMEIITTLRAAA